MQKISRLTKNSTYFLGVMFVVFQFFLAKNAYAQSDTLFMPPKNPLVIHNCSDIFKKRYWHLFIRPLVSIQKGTIYKDNDFYFAIKSAPGFQFGGNVSFGLPKRFALETGFNVEVNYFKFENGIRQNFVLNNVGMMTKINSFNLLAFIIPVYCSYRIPIYNKKNNFFIETKLGLDLKLGQPQPTTSEDYAQLSDSSFLFVSYINKGWNTQNLQKTNHPQFSASIVSGIGFNFILKNQRILHFQIIGTYNPFINDNGTITFVPDSPYEKVIPFRNYINTLGFELNYRFTKYPKRQKGFKASLKEEYRSKPIRELR